MIEGWARAELKELLVTLESGLRPKGGASEDSGEIPSLGGENIIQKGGVDVQSVKRIPDSFYRKLNRGKLKLFDVLINKDGANTGKVGLYNIRHFKEAAINEHLFLLRGKGITQEYLYYYLLSPPAQAIIKNKINGSAQPGLNSTFIKDFFLDIPKTSDEQGKISEILIQIDEVIDGTQRIIGKNKLIKIGLMQDLFSKGLDEKGNIRSEKTHKFKDSKMGSVPDEWQTKSLFSLSDSMVPICYGIVQVKGWVEGGIPTLAIKDMCRDYKKNIHLTSPVIESQYKRSRVQSGDLLISIKGTTGKVDLVPKHFQGNISRDIARIRFQKGIIPAYYKYYFLSQKGNWELEFITVGTTRKEISIAPLKSLKVPFPSETERSDVSQILKSFSTKEANCMETLNKLQKLKAGLMQDILTGKVRVTPLMKEAVA